MNGMLTTIVTQYHADIQGLEATCSHWCTGGHRTDHHDNWNICAKFYAESDARSCR